jgi:hypothetical protein
MRLAGLGLSALIITLAPVAGAQDLASAHDFVAGLYAAYHGRGPDYLGRQARTTFSPALLKLIERAAAATPADEVGALDGDPICDCQDSGGLKVTDITIAGGANGRAIATVRFRLPDDPRTLRLDLVAVDGHWRVNDVHSADTPSLAAYLRHSLGKAH